MFLSGTSLLSRTLNPWLKPSWKHWLMRLVRGCLLSIFLLSVMPLAYAGDAFKGSCDAQPFKTGLASIYAKMLGNRKTTSEESLDLEASTAAMREMPMNTYIKVVDTETGASEIVRVNDKGPQARRHIIDLTPGTEKRMGWHHRDGVHKVKLYLCHD